MEHTLPGTPRLVMSEPPALAGSEFAAGAAKVNCRVLRRARKEVLNFIMRIVEEGCGRLQRCQCLLNVWVCLSWNMEGLLGENAMGIYTTPNSLFLRLFNSN